MADRVYELAARLRRRHGNPRDKASFTHTPCLLEPATVLVRLRQTALNELMVADGTLLTDLETPSYDPIQPVHAAPEHLAGVGVTASTWDSDPQGRAAELAFYLTFEEAAKALVRFMLWASESTAPMLIRVFYDHQRAETGYEGGRRVIATPSTDQVDAFLSLIHDLTGDA